MITQSTSLLRQRLLDNLFALGNRYSQQLSDDSVAPTKRVDAGRKAKAFLDTVANLTRMLIDRHDSSRLEMTYEEWDQWMDELSVRLELSPSGERLASMSDREEAEAILSAYRDLVKTSSRYRFALAAWSIRAYLASPTDDPQSSACAEIALTRSGTLAESLAAAAAELDSRSIVQNWLSTSPTQSELVGANARELVLRAAVVLAIRAASDLPATIPVDLIPLARSSGELRRLLQADQPEWTLAGETSDDRRQAVAVFLQRLGDATSSPTIIQPDSGRLTAFITEVKEFWQQQRFIVDLLSQLGKVSAADASPTLPLRRWTVDVPSTFFGASSEDVVGMEALAARLARDRALREGLDFIHTIDDNAPVRDYERPGPDVLAEGLRSLGSVTRPIIFVPLSLTLSQQIGLPGLLTLRQRQRLVTQHNLPASAQRYVAGTIGEAPVLAIPRLRTRFIAVDLSAFATWIQNDAGRLQVQVLAAPPGEDRVILALDERYDIAVEEPGAALVMRVPRSGDSRSAG